MATGICYTWSGNVKKYEGINSSDIPNKVTVYTVGYPSTAYYPDGGMIYFSLVPYPPPPGYPEVEGFVEGTAHYITNMYLNDTSNTIYDLMSYTPPYGYVLSENGSYTYTATATVYSYNYGIKYFSKTNIVNGGTVTVEREFRYKKKDNKVYVRLLVSDDIIINGNTYHSYENKPTIKTIDLESSYSNLIDILVGLDSNHYTGGFDISFEGASPSNEKIYLLVNNKYYDVTNSTSNESKKCHISKYKDRFHIVGWMYTTGGFDYTFSSNDWESNSLLTQEGTKDSSGGYIPSNVKAKFVVKFTLNNGYYHQDCQLTVDITTNK